MPRGYHGKILHVNLTDSAISREQPGEAFYRKYLGGSAMGMYYILNGMLAGADPLGPENILTLMLSVLTGAPISGQSRLTANASSPLVDGIGDSQCGGFFPAELKFAGFDGIVVRGQSPQPVYLWIKDGEAELRDAAHLWGKTTGTVDEILKNELGDKKIEIMQCGPAGEKLVRVAAIINMANRAAGRTGLGAVMGAKRLKAVVARGSSKRLPVADQKGLNAFARAGAAAVEENAGMVEMRSLGTAGVTAYQNAVGGLPTNNFNAGQFKEGDSISGETMTDTILTGNDTCYACTVRCKRAVETEFEGEAVHERYGGPEYETLATFGSYCGVSDLNAVALANQLCNEHGLDTIGAGATVAWAMDCFEHGLISAEEVSFPIPMGDARAMVRLTKMLANREGFGDVLAEGSRAAADRIGKGHEFLITVKGAEAPAHMPQVKRSLGLIYAVNPFGADHQSSEHDPAVESDYRSNAQRMQSIGINQSTPEHSLERDKVRYALTTQHLYSFLDSANLCQFVWGSAWQLFGPEDTVRLVRTVTGWEDFSIAEMLQVGERRLNMLRAFNAREGVDRAADRLPGKFFRALQGEGPSAGMTLDIEEILQAQDWYYEMSGWDAGNGNPTPETLARLGLEWIPA
ncbi:MAG TPA: aldehyde ferredoxin oxidoreductase family protein [Anaerolineales bacterium]|jgi:aldehyde:ferredoxin oxidoreductase|nr:aldehyde ferredoxin oxidoreductase family protein [Anaerolineales bacterium]